MDDIYENVEEYNKNEECKILIVFDYIIANMLSNKKTSTNSNKKINKSLNRSHLIIHFILKLKTLSIFTKKCTAKPSSF